MKTLSIPAVPNRPLFSKEEVCVYGDLMLRKNLALNFFENSAFDSSIVVYDQNYQNSQAYSRQFHEHMNEVACFLRNKFSSGAVVVEIGCGKGDFFSLLEEGDYFKAYGFDSTYEGTNNRIEKRYLVADDRMSADLIVLRHTLEHIHKPQCFLKMLKNVFCKGKIYIEVPSFEWIIDNEAFFDITYEHVNYFTEESLLNLFSGRCSEVGRSFGGQYQYIIADIQDVSDDFDRIYKNGQWVDINFFELFSGLKQRINIIEELLAKKNRCYIWGAATKGCLFLVHCGFLNKIIDRVEFAVDINPNKVGRFLPGSLVPIRGVRELFENATSQDLLIVSNPNYMSEILIELSGSPLEGISVVAL